MPATKALPVFKPQRRSGKCSGCASGPTEIKQRAGERLCRSCWLLNEHLDALGGSCEGCDAGTCPYRTGDATE